MIIIAPVPGYGCLMRILDGCGLGFEWLGN
jgi:hypothetical protein